MQHRNWKWRWVSSSPWIVRLGSLPPRSASAWKIDRMDSLKVRDRTQRFLVVISPVLHFRTKALRMFTGSLYETSRGSSSTSLNNVAHLDQCPSLGGGVADSRETLGDVIRHSPEAILEMIALGGFYSRHGSLFG